MADKTPQGGAIDSANLGSEHQTSKGLERGPLAFGSNGPLHSEEDELSEILHGIVWQSLLETPQDSQATVLEVATDPLNVVYTSGAGRLDEELDESSEANQSMSSTNLDMVKSSSLLTVEEEDTLMNPAEKDECDKRALGFSDTGLGGAGSVSGKGSARLAVDAEQPSFLSSDSEATTPEADFRISRSTRTPSIEARYIAELSKLFKEGSSLQTSETQAEELSNYSSAAGLKAVDTTSAASSQANQSDTAASAGLHQVADIRKVSGLKPPARFSGPGPPSNVSKKPNLGHVNSGRPNPRPKPQGSRATRPSDEGKENLSGGLLNNGRESVDNGRPLTASKKDFRIESKVERATGPEGRSHSAMGFMEAAVCGRPAEDQKKAGPKLTLPHVMSRKQKAALSLRSGNFRPQDLPAILSALKEDLEKRPKYTPPKSPKYDRRAPARLEKGARKHGSLSGPLSRSDPHFAAQKPEEGVLPVIKITPELEEKLRERREQQEAKAYGQLHDQQIESSIEIVNSLGGELNTWRALAQTKEEKLERLQMSWRGEREGLSREAVRKGVFGEEAEQLSEQLEEIAGQKEAVMVDKLGLNVLVRRLHDDMRQDLSTLDGIRTKFQKLSGSCRALVEDIKRSHMQKEQAEADAAGLRARIFEARLVQAEKLAEERARRDTARKLSRDKETAEARRRARAQEAREESLVAAKDAAVKSTQAVFATELAKAQSKLRLIKMSAAFQRIVDATGLRDVEELVHHFRDPKDRIDKWKAEKDRAEERIAALKSDYSALKVVLGDFEVEGYSTRLRWKEFDALESKQLATELTYLRLREGVDFIKYRIQEVQSSLETVANSAGISLSGVDLFTGKSVEPSPITKPLETRATALSAEMFGLPPGHAFLKLVLASSDGAARLVGEISEGSDAASSFGDTRKGAYRTKGDSGSGLIFVPGAMNGVPPDTAVDITRVLSILQLKLERLFEASGNQLMLEHSSGHLPGDFVPGTTGDRSFAGLLIRGPVCLPRKKEARSAAYHALVEALEWFPPSEKLPEKPKDLKETVDRATMTAAVVNFIAAGIAAAAVLPLPKAQLEKFASRIFADALQEPASPLLVHYPTFNHRMNDAHNSAGKQPPKAESVGSGLWAARVLLEEMKGENKQRPMEDGHVDRGSKNRSRRSTKERDRSRRASAKLDRSGSGDFRALLETGNGNGNGAGTETEKVPDVLSGGVPVSAPGKAPTVLSSEPEVRVKKQASGSQAIPSDKPLAKIGKSVSGPVETERLRRLNRGVTERIEEGDETDAGSGSGPGLGSASASASASASGLGSTSGSGSGSGLSSGLDPGSGGSLPEARAEWLAAGQKVHVQLLGGAVPLPNPPPSDNPSQQASTRKQERPPSPPSPESRRVRRSKGIAAEAVINENEEDTSIFGARKDLVLFRKRNVLHKSRRMTALESDLKDLERKQKLEERYRNVMRFIPGLAEEMNGETVGGIGAKPPGKKAAESEPVAETETEQAAPEGELGGKGHVRWT